MQLLLQIVGISQGDSFITTLSCNGSHCRSAGIGFHLRCVATGINLLFKSRASLKTCYSYIFFPMDSTRYFEFQEVWKSVKGFVFTRYLDVSSPRLMPLFLLKAAPGATAELINPDSSDLKETEKLASALGLKSRCGFFNGILDNARLIPDSFDLITCISVLEHIPQDKAVIETMWSTTSSRRETYPYIPLYVPTSRTVHKS